MCGDKMKKEVKCNVCEKIKPREEMRKGMSGRVMHHCRDCAGKHRCIHCGKVRESKHFKVSGSNKYFFDDGEEQRASVCYTCDYQMNKERYSRYDKKMREGGTIRCFVLSNFTNWRDRSKKKGLDFDITPKYLLEMWDRQNGRCFYTGELLSLDRGHGKWSSLSLDRKDPSVGYVKGNVVWTSREVNSSKGTRTMDEFFDFCRRVVKCSCQDKG